MVKMFTSVAVPVVILVILNLSGSSAQFLASPVPCLYPPVGNIISAACNNDCIQEHGAISGVCTPSNVCACHYLGDKMAPLPNDTVPHPILDPLKSDPLQQCVFDDRTWPILGTPGILYGAYTAGCNLDCQCIHGASSGTCNFITQRCHCNYPANATFANVNTYACLYCLPGEAAYVIGSHFNKTSYAIYNAINFGGIFTPLGDLVLVPSTNFLNGNCSNPPPA